MRQVLAQAAYRRLLVAYTLNEVALSIGVLALALLVYRRTGSVIGATGFFLCSQFIPALVSLPVVARIDRRPVRAMLPALYALEGLAFVVLAWLASHFSLVPVLALAILDGIAALTARATARTATVAVLSPFGLLRDGNALMNASFSVCFLVGPALGGVIVATGGTSAALLANAVLFALIAFTVATARGLPAGVSVGAPRARLGLRAALDHARESPAIRRLLSLQAGALLFFTMSIPVEVVFAQHVLHTGAGGYGALLAAWGGGAVAGSAAYARWRRWPSRTLITVGCALLGSGLVLMAAAPSIVLAAAAAAVGGAGNGIEAVSARTALQEQVEPRWMALMMSLNESIFQAVPGAGIAVGGAIGALAGPRAALAVAGAGGLAMTGLVWGWLERPRRSVDSRPVDSQSRGTVGGGHGSSSAAPVSRS
jgi:predicted MFS family arabinose efflux permease